MTFRWRGLAVLAGSAVLLLAGAMLFPARVPLGVVAQGVMFGCGTGILAVGLVLTYRSTRVVNFAYGAMGGLPAAIAIALFLGHGWPWPLAVLLAIVLGALIGATVERLVIQRFANAPRLLLTVATIGLAQVLGGAEFFVPQYLKGPALIGPFSTPLDRFKVSIDPVILTGNDLLLGLSVPVVLAVLTWFLFRTESGIAIRGAAENRDRAQLLGIPVSRLAVLVWSIAGAVAAAAVLLRAPSEGLAIDAAAGPAILLPALAAAVAARMERLSVAFWAGVGLGVVDQLVRWNVDKQAVTTVVFLGVILAALLLDPRRESPAEAAGESSWSAAGTGRAIPAQLARLPEVKIARWALIGAALAVALVVPLVAPPSQLDVISIGIVYAMVAISLVVLTGWGGTVSLGQVALAGMGGLVVANLVGRWNVDLFVGLLAAAATGGVIALLLGLPALRVRGLFLAVTTLAFAVMADSFLLNPVNFRQLIPGAFERPVLWKRFDLASERPMYYFCLATLVLVVLLVRGLQLTRPGRVLRAARDNRRAAAAAGIAINRVRIMGFVISGVIAGLAGGLHATILRAIGFHTYEPSQSLLAFSMAVIGGISSLGGAMSGVGVVLVAGQLFPKLQLVITGAGLLLVLMVFPGGIAAAAERLRDVALAWLARRRGISFETSEPAEPSAPAPVAAPGSTAPTPAALLSCRGVTASYGSLQVLFGVDFDVREGELVALLGTNGAGKSTLLRTISNLLPPDGGKLAFGGRDLRGMAPERVAAAGIGVMPGGRGIFPTLTVAENLRLSCWLLRRQGSVAATAKGEVLELFPILSDRLDTAAGSLSGGEQQMLSLAMAMVNRPRLLCIDELSLGLSPLVVGQLVDAVRDIHAGGTTVVVVEQSVNVALLVAQRATFLEKGRVRFEGPTRDLLSRPDLLRAVFLGGHGDDKRPGRVAAGAARRSGRGPDVSVRPMAPLAPAAVTDGNGIAPAIRCTGLTKRFGGIIAVDHVDLAIPAGRIVGVIGHNGAGKTTLFDLLSGFLVPTEGEVDLAGAGATRLPPHRRAALGLGRSFQEARLYPTLTVGEALAVGLERHLASREPVAAAFRLPASLDAEAEASDRVDELVELLGLGAYRDRMCGELSTGTRRVVELAGILAQQPSVVLLDEPSAGIAQREAEALAPLLLDVQKRTGSSIVIIEHDIPLLRSLCDEFVALELGSIIAQGAPAHVLDNARVIASYLGTDQEVVARSGRRR